MSESDGVKSYGGPLGHPPEWDQKTDKPSLAEQIEAKCPECDGECGAYGEESHMWYPCHSCKGSGFASIDRRAITGELRDIAEEIRANRARYGSKTTLPAWADRLARKEP